MEVEKQIINDLNIEEYKYQEKYGHLSRGADKVLKRVDINVLNKRLNEAKKSNFYITTVFTLLGLSLLIILSVVGLKF